jgi:hypothetical protein
LNLVSLSPLLVTLHCVSNDFVAEKSFYCFGVEWGGALTCKHLTRRQSPHDGKRCMCDDIRVVLPKTQIHCCGISCPRVVKVFTLEKNDNSGFLLRCMLPSHSFPLLPSVVLFHRKPGSHADISDPIGGYLWPSCSIRGPHVHHCSEGTLDMTPATCLPQPHQVVLPGEELAGCR